RAKYQRRVRLVQPSDDPLVDATATAGRKLTDAQQRVIEAIKAQESLAFPELLSVANVGSSTVASLQKRGLVEIFEERQRRDPLGHTRFEQPEDYVLTEAQERVL